MESNFEHQHDPASARETLEAISADRGRLGERITAETWWAAPAQGLAAALIIATPAAGFTWAWLPFVLSVAIFTGVEVFFRRRSGLGISMPAGPRGLWLLVALFVIFFFSCVTSMGLALFGQIGWVIALALATGVITALFVMAYDRAYAAEVRHAD